MAKEVLDIVDTAVKVGLGASISGIATYFVTRSKNASESRRENIKRRWEFVGIALDAADEYILALGHFFAVLDGLRKDNPGATTIEETGEADAVEKYSASLMDAIAQRNRAFSRLKAIGETKAAGALHKLQELEDEIRTRVIFANELPNDEKLNSWLLQIRETRELFLSELNTTHQDD